MLLHFLLGNLTAITYICKNSMDQYESIKCGYKEEIHAVYWAGRYSKSK